MLSRKYMLTLVSKGKKISFKSWLNVVFKEITTLARDLFRTIQNSKLWETIKVNIHIFFTNFQNFSLYYFSLLHYYYLFFVYISSKTDYVDGEMMLSIVMKLILCFISWSINQKKQPFVFQPTFMSCLQFA
jgi:hypothetical protein